MKSPCKNEDNYLLSFVVNDDIDEYKNEEEEEEIMKENEKAKLMKDGKDSVKIKDGNCSSSSSSSCPKQSSNNNLVVVLDLDYTMVWPREVKSVIPEQLTVDTVVFNYDKETKWLLEPRPYLNEFLHHVCNKYETYVFTAASPIYANYILDQIDPTNHLFKKRWYNDSCSQFKLYGGSNANNINNNNDDDDNDGTIILVKDLKKVLGEDKKLDRVVIIDDNMEVFWPNPSNGIKIEPFCGDPNDNELLVMKDLLDELNAIQGDIRPTLERKFLTKFNLELKRMYNRKAR